MNIEHTGLIKNRIRQSDVWISGKSHENGRYINGLRCPSCGESDAYLYIATPWTICCNRLNHCRAKTPIRDIFRDLYDEIEQCYPPVESDRHRPARVYLQARGLNKCLDGLRFEYWVDERSGNGAVMFLVRSYIDPDKTAWNGRFISERSPKKSHNQGATSGMFWHHPGRELDLTREVFFTESILDALSLIEHGRQAIAVLSAGASPSSFELPQFQKITLAFDADIAGRGALRRWKEAYPNASAIEPPKEGIKDWNDWFLSVGKDHSKADAKFEEKRPEMEWRARLALAKTAREYAEIFYTRKTCGPGLFKFEKELFFASKKRNPEGEIEMVVKRVGNFTLQTDHFQLDSSSPDEPVHRFHLEITPKIGRPIRCTATADELSSPHGLRTFFLARGKVLWSGDGEASTALIDKIVSSGKAPCVRQLQGIGYDEQSRYFVFPQFAITSSGKLIEPNKQGFFEISRSNFLRPARYRTILPRAGQTSPVEIFNLLNTAWPDRAAVAVAFLVASWFVHDIRPRLGFFPFLSLWGKPQTGKSRLVRLLNGIQAVDEEGLPLNKVNTAKGELRKLAQFNSLCKGMLEAKGQEKVRFDFDALLTLYNHGNALQTRAATSNDLRSLEVAFGATLLFAQNIEPFSSRAQKERVISLQFKLGDLNPDTTQAYSKLLQVSPGELAAFFPAIMKHRKMIEDVWFEKYEVHRVALLGWLKNSRIAENHAIISAFCDLLGEILETDLNLTSSGCFIEKVARQKLRDCEDQPVSPADLFLETLMQLPSDTNDVISCVTEKTESGELLKIVNLPGVLKTMSNRGFRIDQRLDVLQEALKQHPSFRWHGRNRLFTETYIHNDVPKHKSVQLKSWGFSMVQLQEERQTECQ